MSTTKRLALALLFFLSLLVVSAGAQEVSRFEVMGGYTYWRYDSPKLGFADNSMLSGGKAALTFNLTPNFGVVGEVGGGWGSPIRAYSALAGPQLSFHRGNATIFVQGLFGKGKTHVETYGPATSSGRAYSAGAGVDWNINRRFSWRALQVDYFNTHSFDTSENNLRVTTGIIFHFGGRMSIRKREKLPEP
jgi:hypothetical protein